MTKAKPKVAFPPFQLEGPPTTNLCTKYNGVYVDVRRAPEGSWGVVWDTVHLAVRGLASRDEALEWLDKNIKALSKDQFKFIGE